MKKILLFVSLALMAVLSGCVDEADMGEDVASAASPAGPA